MVRIPSSLPRNLLPSVSALSIPVGDSYSFGVPVQEIGVVAKLRGASTHVSFMYKFSLDFMRPYSVLANFFSL
jgi:hypothetical protein